MDDLKLIKKHYGEKMMHLCRQLFPTILEKEGELFSIISEHFAYSKFLDDDITNNHMEVEFKDYIFSFIDVEKKVEEKVIKSPKELLDEVGYELFLCHNEEEIQSFKKYYAKGEELCTFRGGRLGRCHVFFAVKKDVDKIKRENFAYPQRQDEYGTSVISIQFTKDSSNTLSIKNRYNHAVNSPDATFSNNLDNIIPGLTESFNKYYNFNANNEKASFEIPGYVKANDGKYYKYNYEENNIYYCPNNIIIDYFEVKEYDKAQYVIVDNLVVDLTNKKIYPYDKSDLHIQSFIKSIGDIDSIRVESNKETGDKNIIINNDIIIGINKKNQLTRYINNKVTKIDDYFLDKNETLEYLELNSVEDIGTEFLLCNNVIKELYLPKVVNIGDKALHNNLVLEKVNMPKVKYLGARFAYNCASIKSIYMPELEKLGDDSFYNGDLIEIIGLPKVTNIGQNVFHRASNLRFLSIPSAVEIKDGSFTCVDNLEEINAENVEVIGNMVFRNASLIRKIDLPKATSIGDAFLLRAEDIEEVYIPNIDEESYNRLRGHIKNALNRNGRGAK